MSIKWSLGIITAPRKNSTLETTIHSLKNAGWKDFQVFDDKAKTLGPWRNWISGLSQLYSKNPTSDWYFMLEDDVELYSGNPNLRTYLESTLSQLKNTGIVSLYQTAPISPEDRGWNTYSLGWHFCGALAILIPKSEVKNLLEDPVLNENHFKFNDALIGQWVQRKQKNLYAHTPSLAKHIGESSTIGNDSQDIYLRNSTSFLGDLDNDSKLWNELQFPTKKMESSSPLISCLMVTNFREKLCEKSIQCFIKQTYKNKELIIVTDGEPEKKQKMEKWFLKYNDFPIQLYFYEGNHSLGWLRNRSVEKANGKILCQWDDDDLNYPNRISVQYEKMRSNGSVASFLTSQIHFFEKENRFYFENWAEKHPYPPCRWIPGTLMIRKAFLEQYPEISHGEDSYIVDKLLEKNWPVAEVSHNEMTYIYTYHGENVWDLEHHEDQVRCLAAGEFSWHREFPWAKITTK